jgi:ketosteroid isomerase-like protein
VSQESTTPDLVERFRRSVEAFNRRDIDGVMSFYSPDVVWDGLIREVGRFEGAAALHGFFEEWLIPYEEFRLEVEESVDLGNGVTFAAVHQMGRLIDTQGYIQQRAAQALLWEKGLIIHVTVYLDRDEARAAAERLAKERAQADA